MIHGYRPGAIVYNASTGSWSLKPGYDLTVDRVAFTFSDDDPYLDGDYTHNETGDDPNQMVSVRDPQGRLICSGRYYDENFYTLRAPNGDTLWIDRIEINGVHAGWVVTMPLEEGVSYRQIGSGDVTSSADTKLVYADLASVPCFGPGTMIQTDRGEQPVEWIARGDRVLTRDRGYQPVLWTGRYLPVRSASDHGARIFEIAADTFGPGIPHRTLRLSAQHRVLLADPVLELCFGTHEMFAAAHLLVSLQSARETLLGPGEGFYHLLLREHEVILADGLWVESLFCGPAFLRAQPDGTRRLLASLTAGRHRQLARPCLHRREIALVAGSRRKARDRAA